MSPEVKELNPTALLAIDSRSRPTVRVCMEMRGRDIQVFVPSGASTGINEALELRDGGNKYLGFGVEKAIRNLGEIILAIKDIDIEDQKRIDRTMIELDGTENKSRLGANAILAVSLGVAHAAAEYRQVPLFKYLADLYGNEKPNLLPTPMMNVINGGVHAKNNLPFQEFMIDPVGAKTFSDAVRMGSEVYQTLGGIVDDGGVGDEGGFSPNLRSDTAVGRIDEALGLLVNATRKRGYKPKHDIAIALDPAASEFFKDGKYYLSESEILNSADLVGVYKELIRDYPVISIEDGMAQDDDEGWRLFFGHVGHQIQTVGDDRYCTTVKRIREGITRREANAVLIKLNQIGTLTETLTAIKTVQDAGWEAVISHRSGETEDTTIADLAVATGAGQIKTGAPARGERTAKYNRLLLIEEKLIPRLGLTPVYAGRIPFPFLC